MRSILLLVVTVLVFSATASNAQRTEVNLAQKSVKRSLMKYAPRVHGIKFDQCQASVKFAGRFESVSVSKPRVVSTGTRPGDDASRYLSTGPGNDRWLTFVTRVILFDKIDPATIRIDPTIREGLVNIAISALSGEKGIFLRAGKDRKQLSSITFQVKASKAEEVAGVLGKLASACKLDRVQR